MLRIFEERKAEIESLLKIQPLCENQNDRINLAFTRAAMESQLVLYTDGAKIQSDDPAELKDFLESFQAACLERYSHYIKEESLHDAMIAACIEAECEHALKLMREAHLI